MRTARMALWMTLITIAFIFLMGYIIFSGTNIL